MLVDGMCACCEGDGDLCRTYVSVTNRIFGEAFSVSGDTVWLLCAHTQAIRTPDYSVLVDLPSEGVNPYRPARSLASLVDPNKLESLWPV